MSQLITILGSTGSIGLSTLKVVDEFSDEFEIYGLVCNRNLTKLQEQVEKYRPQAVAVADLSVATSETYKKMKKENPSITFYEGQEGICELVHHHVDVVLSAIVGAAGLLPSLESLPYTKRMALANKETLVMGGGLFKEEVRKNNVELIPVDSEHSAIFALLAKEEKSNVEKLIITASGGSLRNCTLEELKTITPQKALAHPTWKMGAKITIDSATLMNKGLEVIEAHHLFDMPYDKIEVVVHPQSVVHSLIETVDGAIFAHLGVTDMVFPIISALTWPHKVHNNFGKLDLATLGTINFEKYDPQRFPALNLCYEAGRIGATMPVVLNGANEIAVNAFINEKIKFLDLIKVVEKTMSVHKVLTQPTIEDVFNIDKWARVEAEKNIRGL